MKGNAGSMSRAACGFCPKASIADDCRNSRRADDIRPQIAEWPTSVNDQPPCVPPGSCQLQQARRPL
eukprot:6492094-Amphidinium_carterae.1